MVARNCVAASKVTLVAAMPSKVTVAPETRSVPVMVTSVPPSELPEGGATTVIVGGSPR